MNKQEQKPQNVQQISFLRKRNSVFGKCIFWFSESEIRSVTKSSMNSVKFCRLHGHTVTVFLTIIISLNQSYDGDNLCAAETWHNFDVKLARLINGNVSEGGQLLREA